MEGDGRKTAFQDFPRIRDAGDTESGRGYETSDGRIWILSMVSFASTCIHTQSFLIFKNNTNK